MPREHVVKLGESVRVTIGDLLRIEGEPRWFEAVEAGTFSEGEKPRQSFVTLKLVELEPAVETEEQ